MYNNYLSHYGIMGMHWGQRKQRSMDYKQKLTNISKSKKYIGTDRDRANTIMGNSHLLHTCSSDRICTIGYCMVTNENMDLENNKKFQQIQRGSIGFLFSSRGKLTL